MAMPHMNLPHPARGWWKQARAELANLWAEVAEVIHRVADRVRSDPAYRNAILQGLLKGLIAALSRGPRATVLWTIALVCQVVLDLLDALQGGFEGDAYV